MEIYGYSDISNLVHRTINGYFNQLPEIKNARRFKKTLSEKEYREKIASIKDRIIEEKRGNIEKLLLNMCFKGLESFRKDNDIKEENLFVVLDSVSWRKEFIEQFYQDNKEIKEHVYKAGRNKIYKDFIYETINKLKELTEEIGYNVYQKEGLEADDIIALLIKNNKDKINIIASNDHDFYQLQKQENVKQYNPMEKLSEKRVIDLTPKEAERELLLKIVLGDSSDNIPSIYKIENEGIKLPRLGEDTIKGILEQENVNSEEELLQNIILKIYTNSQFEDINIKKKYIKEIKDLPKNIKNHEEYEKEISKIIKKEIKEIEDKIEKIENTVKKSKEFKALSEELTDIEKFQQLDKQNLKQREKLLEQKRLILEFGTKYSYEDIRDKIMKKYYFNKKIIDFDEIPEELKNKFLKEMTIKETKEVSNKEKSKIFEKYELFKISEEYKNKKEEKKVEKKKKIEGIIKEGDYVEIKIKLPKNIEDFLQKKKEDNKAIVLFNVDNKEYWRLRIKKDKNNIVSDEEVDFAKKLYKRIKEVLSEEKNQRNTMP